LSSIPQRFLRKILQYSSTLFELGLVDLSIIK